MLNKILKEYDNEAMRKSSRIDGGGGTYLCNALFAIFSASLLLLLYTVDSIYCEIVSRSVHCVKIS